jgi:hypothetical protein
MAVDYVDKVMAQDRMGPEPVSLEVVPGLVEVEAAVPVPCQN